MNHLWTDKALWSRIALVASACWLGVIVIVSAISRNFEWFPNSYLNPYNYSLHFGPASVTASVGIAVIYAVCVGIPWIADAANKKQGSDWLTSL